MTVVLLGLLPQGLNVYQQHVMIVSLFYVMMAASWNLLAGYTGQVSFAHAAFAGIGAYTSGILAVKLGLSPWLGIPLGVLCAALVGFGVGLLCLKMGGIYLSLTTLGVSEIFHIIINNEYEITRGTMGLQIPGLLTEYSKTGYYYIMLMAAIISLAVIYLMIHSNLGLNFRAVQNDEKAASSLGVDVIRIRVLAFTVSSALAGLAGGVYGHYLLLITPEIPSLDQQFLVLSMTIIGGMGSFLGPIIGAFTLEILSEYIRSYGEYHVLAFGLVALTMARFAPNGVVGLARAGWAKISAP
ncbi:MAG: branched-chain amino acid ABC transporter permease [Deltaproteobacteria bacterium]|nr:branched-chain amino acid ABC transporter permease [Candidatus Anaeroferrophillus wilburensis]MBN2889008.1 branched-chain amino acid ABC transporter permease [Deltaproteobacteria bacterium]